MFAIKKITARQILDSRGIPTIEADICLSDGAFGRASVPSGASIGGKEAVELRDRGNAFGGMSVKRAIDSIHYTIAPKIKDCSFNTQEELDHALIELDGSSDKSNLGANAILAISVAFAKACAASLNMPLFEALRTENGALSAGTIEKLPVPMFNLINGGQHADNKIDVQEFMVIPNIKSDFLHKLEVGYRIFHVLKRKLQVFGMQTNVGDEGGFAPALSSTQEVLEILLSSIVDAGFRPGEDIFIALDIAANSHYLGDGKYWFRGMNLKLDREQLIRYYQDIISKYYIASLEDPLAEEDLLGWQMLTAQLGDKVSLVGDDIFVTNKSILQKCIDLKIANTALIKVNQVGTITEALEAVHLAKMHNYKIIASHRSGETEDVFLSHFAVSLNCDYIKAGSVSRTDRVCKYNEMLRIEEFS